MAMERTIAPSSKTAKESDVDWAKRNPELADAMSRKYYLEHSGHLANTNHEFKAFIGIFEGLKELGFDTSPLIKTFNAFEVLTPDPQSRKDVLQMFAQPKIVIPGVGAGILAGEEKKGGLISWVKGKLSGNKEGEQT